MQEIDLKVKAFISEVISYDTSVILKQAWAKLDRLDFEDMRLCNQYLIRKYMDIVVICNSKDAESFKKQKILEV